MMAENYHTTVKPVYNDHLMGTSLPSLVMILTNVLTATDIVVAAQILRHHNFQKEKSTP